MRQRSRRKRSLLMICIILVTLGLLIFGMVWKYTIYLPVSQGYYPLEKVMALAGFDKVQETKYQNGQLNISVDDDKQQLIKNGYTFSTAQESINIDGVTYLSEELLEKVLNQDVSYEKFKLSLSDFEEVSQSWLSNHANLVAHAGGAHRGEYYNTFYTNSLEALQQNYSLGHRVFEFDFFLTSDNQLAVVHDWDQFGYMNGQALSAEEWKNFSTFGSPVTDSRFTTMLIGDLLDQMMINKDLFVITDTKSIVVSDEMTAQFEAIYRAAMERDPKLLNRIIPQIYSDEMYNHIKSIYPFPSIIYTLYATQPEPEKLLAFIADRPDIEVITSPATHPAYTNPEFIKALHSLNKKLYVHTIHTYDELTKYAGMGIDGFYTGLLLPEDFERYHALK